MAKSKLKAPKLKAPKLKSPKICTSNMCIMVLLLFILFFVLYTQTNIFNNKTIEGLFDIFESTESTSLSTDTASNKNTEAKKCIQLDFNMQPATKDEDKCNLINNMKIDTYKKEMGGLKNAIGCPRGSKKVNGKWVPKCDPDEINNNMYKFASGLDASDNMTESHLTGAIMISDLAEQFDRNGNINRALFIKKKECLQRYWRCND